MLEIQELSKVYRANRGVFKRSKKGMEVVAVNEVDLDVPWGTSLGIVGESGSGKSTLGYCVSGLLAPTAGQVLFGGRRLVALSRRERVRQVQIVFQDPYASLNPRRRVGSVLEEVCRVHHGMSRAPARIRAEELLERVGLAAEMTKVYPGSLSGGQRQRVAIARALAFEPSVIVADEVVSALDASVQAQVLNLLSDLRDDLSLTLLFVTHNLAVVQQICDSVVVMQKGEIVERGKVDTVLSSPRHAYTKALLAAVPRQVNSMAV